MKRILSTLTATILACGLIFSALAGSAEAGPNPVVIMDTSMGRIMVMLYPKDAPETVANFLKYVDSGFYDKTIFHRVIRQRSSGDADDKSMNIVQGGGYTFPIRRKQAMAPIPNEAATGLINAKGTIAMARGNASDSATCEFFFNVEDNPVLDYKQSSKQIGAGSYSGSTSMGYCAFGKVIRGMDVVESIHQVETARSGRMEDVPVTPIFIKKAYLAK
jgi:peptidyl-prolyl cis-trans isomerase A (cyclophilin A)/peptidyl-prolyl cis-trans isomerase B (cyclophilin B)